MDTHRNREQTAVWKRLDQPGHEMCRVFPTDAGWRVTGLLATALDGKACGLHYAVDCDHGWVTRSAVVTGWNGDQVVDLRITRDAEGRWQRDWLPCAEVAGCVDIDLSFSPATNLLPIRRLDLPVGASATVRAAWLRFPSLVLEPLEQTYTRVHQQVYRYESDGGQFSAEVAVDEVGLVIDYGDIWMRERLDHTGSAD